jgi:hypothetical protein
MSGIDFDVIPVKLPSLPFLRASAGRRSALGSVAFENASIRHCSDDHICAFLDHGILQFLHAFLNRQTRENGRFHKSIARRGLPATTQGGLRLWPSFRHF